MEEAFFLPFMKKILDNIVMSKVVDNTPLNFQADIVRPRRRLLAALGDLLLFYIITAALYMLAIYPLTKALPSFKNSVQSQEVSLEACRNMYIDGHLVSRDSNGNAMSSELLIHQYVYNKANKEDFDDNGDYYDPFYYFYVSYANDNLKINGETLSYSVDYVRNEIYKIDEQSEPILWDTSYAGPAKLTDDARTNINKYLNNDITAQNKAYYDKIVDLFKNELVEAEKVLVGSDQYKASYAMVMKENQIIFYHFTISAIITYTVFYFLYFLLVPALFKNGQTFANRILKISFVTRDDKPIPFPTLLLRSVLQYLGYYFFPLIIPYLILGNAIFSLPMITIATFTIDLWLAAVVGIVLCVASFIFNLATTYKQNVYDKITDVYALDLRNMHPIQDKVSEGEEKGDIWK